MEKLYAEYGKAAIDFEIAQARLNEIKKKIVIALREVKNEQKPDQV